MIRSFFNRSRGTALFIALITIGINANLISDGTFSLQKSFSQSTRPWVVQTWNGGSGSISSGGFLYTLTKSGSYFWDNNISQKELILEQGERYSLTFDARSIGASRSIVLSIYDTQKPSNGYDSSGFVLSTTTTTYTHAFTMMKETDYDASIAFNFGLSSIDGWIDNVSLVKITDNRIPEAIPVASPTIERKPTFSWHPSLEPVTWYTVEAATNPSFDLDALIFNQVLADTSFTPAVDLPIGPVYWRVQGDDSYWSSNNFIIKDARIPTPEQYESPTYERRPTLKWSKPPVSVNAYTVEVAKSVTFGVDDIILINSVSDTSYSIAADLPLGEIYWRVKADDSEYSEVSSFVVIDNRIPELIPYKSPTYNRRPILNWHPSLGTVSTYQIQISTDQTFSSIEVLLTVSDTSYTCVADLPIGMIYWRVRGDDSDYSSVQSFEIKDSRIPKLIPVDPNLTENKRQPVSWNAVDGASSYTIQLSAYSNFSTLMASLSVSDTVFTPTADLSAGTVYCRVKSDLVDQWSDLEHFTVLRDDLPLLFRYNGSSVSTRRPEFKWKSVTGATSYKIVFADNAAFSGASVIPVGDTSYTPAIDLTDGSWFWKVSSSLDLSTYCPADEVVIDISVVAPVISTEPVGVIKKEGETAVFSLSASGSKPLTYTWYKNGTAIANSNDTAYSIVNLTPSDSGDAYFCIVSNGAGSDTSNTAILEVQKATGITALNSSVKTINIQLDGFGSLYKGDVQNIKSLKILDMRGRVIYQKKQLKENLIIKENSKMSNGCYLMSVKLKNGVFRRTFIYSR